MQTQRLSFACAAPYLAAASSSPGMPTANCVNLMHGKRADNCAPDIGQRSPHSQRWKALSCAGAPAHIPPPKPALRPMPSGPPEQSQVQRVIQRMQKKDPYRIFAEVPSEEMVSALRLTTLSPQPSARLRRALT